MSTSYHRHLARPYASHHDVQLEEFALVPVEPGNAMIHSVSGHCSCGEEFPHYDVLKHPDAVLLVGVEHARHVALCQLLLAN